MVESRTERNQSRLIELFVAGFPPSAIPNTPYKCSPFVDQGELTGLRDVDWLHAARWGSVRVGRTVVCFTRPSI